MPSPTIFRVHFEDGRTLDVEAEHPDDARAQANNSRAGRITKVKRVKETAQ